MPQHVPPLKTGGRHRCPRDGRDPPPHGPWPLSAVYRPHLRERTSVPSSQLQTWTRSPRHPGACCHRWSTHGRACAWQAASAAHTATVDMLASRGTTLGDRPAGGFSEEPVEDWLADEQAPAEAESDRQPTLAGARGLPARAAITDPSTTWQRPPLAQASYKQRGRGTPDGVGGASCQRGGLCRTRV